MGFNPLQEKGTPIDRQARDWQELNVMPYDKAEVHPYTRTRVILMNGIEAESIWFGHQFARHCQDDTLKRQLAQVRRIEQQQQKMVNWFVPPDESTLEVTIGYEQVAVDLTAIMAKSEPDPNVKAALDFALLEDFDHLYRYANLMEVSEGKQASKVVGELTEIFPGRPTEVEHIHPMDSVRKPYDRNSAHVLTKLHVLTIVAAEQQTMNFYMNVGNRAESELGRGLYLEIAQVEEQHVTHYESLADPRQSWFERLMMHEYNECYMYYSCLESEPDQRIRKHWQRHLEDEIEHLRIACELFKQHEMRDPAEILPSELPQLTIFDSNKDYIRRVLAEQVDLRALEDHYVPLGELGPDSRYMQYQEMVNGKDGFVASRNAVQEHVDRFGEDYRLETQGEHPVERFRSRKKAAA